MKTLKNKIMAIVFIFTGWCSIKIDGDGTVFIFTLILGLPLFFAKENWIDI